MRLYLVFASLFADATCCFKSSTKPVENSARANKESQATGAQNVDFGNSSAVKVDNSVMRNLSESLFALDTNSVGSAVALNHQGKTTSTEKIDAAPLPLFAPVRKEVLEGETFQTFMNILNNYEADVRVNEDESKTEKTEKNKFLDAVMRTEVMKTTQKFLKDKGFIEGNTLRQDLDEVWFTPYSRAKNFVGSSGFEHVFLGELKNNQVSGFHNWVYFSEEEAKNHIDYKGYIQIVDFGSKGEILKLRFNWNNRTKDVGSMFVGTSPELELALYTACFYARGDSICNLQMNKQKFRIRVFTQKYRGKTLLGSAFPEIY